MKKIKNYSDRIAAEMDKGLLEAHGIPCFLSVDDAGGVRPDIMMASGGVWLSVNEEDTQTALQLLDNTNESL